MKSIKTNGYQTPTVNIKSKSLKKAQANEGEVLKQLIVKYWGKRN